MNVVPGQRFRWAEAPSPGDQPPPAQDGQKPRRPRRLLRRFLLILVILLILPGISFTQAMLYPGNAPASVRAVEWVRDHGGGGIVNFFENWLYSRNAPPATGKPDSTGTPAIPVSNGPSPSHRVALPAITLLEHTAPIGDEGRWRVASRSASGQAALYTSWFRPDTLHQPVVAGVALIPRASTVMHLAGGTREPVSGMTWTEGYQVPGADRSGLVAAFNAGWKTHDDSGGWYADGRTAVPLVNGAATLVIHRDGHADVQAWTGGSRIPAGVTALRQNLHLVIENGQLAKGLSTNANGRWGTPKNQFQYTSRSGIGTDRAGDLIYVAGAGLTLASLGTAMQRAGIQTGMELDIHSAMVTFNVFNPSAAKPSPGHKLLSAMTRPANRYLTADQRDFFYVTTR